MPLIAELADGDLTRLLYADECLSVWVGIGLGRVSMLHSSPEGRHGSLWFGVDDDRACGPI